MPRRALLLSIALAGLLLDSTSAFAARTAQRVNGDVTSVAFSANALVVARQLTDQSFRVERLAPGAPAQTILRVPATGDDAFVGAVASAQAVAAVVYLEADEDRNPTQVLVGPPTGPLRQVAACPNVLFPPALAVSGSRVAWTEGGCFTTPDAPVSPMTLVIGGADPATPLRRIPVGDEVLPNGLVLTGDNGFIGLARPSFFSIRGEVRSFGAAGLGEPLSLERPGILAPVGILPTGDAVLVQSELDNEGDTNCDPSVFAVAPGSSQRRPLSFGDCLTDAFSAVTVAGDRVYAIVDEAPRTAAEPSALKSLRGDGTGLHDIIRGTYRPPEGFATSDTGQVAWWYGDCRRGTVVVVDDGSGTGSTRIPSCSLKVLNRTARVRRGRISMRVRCPLGCRGTVNLDARRSSRELRAYSFPAGTHRLALRLNGRERRRSQLRLRFDVGNGLARTALVRLR